MQKKHKMGEAGQCQVVISPQDSRAQVVFQDGSKKIARHATVVHIPLEIFVNPKRDLLGSLMFLDMH